jgi:hypothetical protein
LFSSGLYPPLPVSDTSPREAIQALNHSPDGIVKIAVDDRFAWYISHADQVTAAERLKAMMKAKGWTFTNQEGADYFFAKLDGKTVVTSQMWTGKYVRFRIDKNADQEKRNGK